MKIACLFFNISNDEAKNFTGDDFFTPNAINSFKYWNPEIEVHFINNSNFKEYLKNLKIDEYYDNLGILRIHIIRELMKAYEYDKIILLGVDTFTCARLDEFINNNNDDLICSSGPPYPFLKTEDWQPQIESFIFNGIEYGDVSFINADVTCFNSIKAAETVYDKSVEFWSAHAEQGGLNYCYINQKELGIKVSIVDFPYIKTNVLYNVRSKGIACGGDQMFRGNVYNGCHKDKNNSVIGNVYPTTTYYVKDDKLFTSNDKQIKVFHYAEGLGSKTKEEYNELVNEMKTIWFNKETIEFLKKSGCNF
jgi:hypothetical protein